MDSTINSEMLLPIGIHPASKCPFQFPILDGLVTEETQRLVALGGWIFLDASCVSPILFDAPLVSVLYFAESTREIAATFHTMSSSCQREAKGIF